MTNMSEVRVGGLVNERYLIDEQLSQTERVSVFRATQTALARPVVLKIFERDNTIDDRDDFESEAQALGRLRHPNVVTLYDHGHLADGRLFLVLEYIAGSRLDEVLESGPVPLATCITVGLQVSAALTESHRLGIVHRDVQPTNVILTQRDDGLRVRLIDFGIASVAEQTKHVRVKPKVHDSSRDDSTQDMEGLARVVLAAMTGQVKPSLGVKEALHARLALESQSNRVVLAPLIQFIEETLSGDRHDPPLTANRAQNMLLSTQQALAQMRNQDGDSGKLTGAPIQNRPTDPLGSLTPTVTAAHPTPREPWMPRWRYIVGLGVVSLAVISLGELQERAEENVGKRQPRRVAKSLLVTSLRAQNFVKVRQRHRDFFMDKVSLSDWLERPSIWGTPLLRADHSGVGLVELPLPKTKEDAETERYALLRSSKPESLNEPRNLLRRAALTWHIESLLNPSNPDYRSVIPQLQQLATSDIEPRLLQRVHYFLAVAYRQIGQVERALSTLESVLVGEQNQASVLARIEMLTLNFPNGSKSDIESHIALIRNAESEQLRSVGAFINAVYEVKTKRYDAALESTFSIVDDSKDAEQMPPTLRESALELMVMLSPKISGGSHAVSGFLRGHGGHPLKRYFLPLTALALKTNQTWSKAAEAYTELIELKKARGLGVEPTLILDCAESAQKGHRRDLLEPIQPELQEACKSAPADARPACRQGAEWPRQDGALPAP